MTMVERIADCLIEDHIQLMQENKALRGVLEQLLDAHYPTSCYTAETIEYEMDQGNMAMPMVKRAYALLNNGGESPWVGLTLEEVEDIIKSNITITDPNLYEGVYAVAVDIEHAVLEKNR